MSRQTCRRIAEEIRECVYEKLGGIPVKVFPQWLVHLAVHDQLL